MLILRLSFLMLMISGVAQAYPEFIGYGYTTCLTCHMNGAGNGPLNDYGRGLFAVEIAEKPFWKPNADDNALGEASGILGKTQLPWWFRPGVKYRGLFNVVDPGLKTETQKVYHMQADLSLTFYFDEKQRYMFSGTVGYVSAPEKATPNKTLDGKTTISREHYLRAQFGESTWVYLGFLDKVFGIRHADHTSVNRSNLGIGQNDQVHSLVYHYNNEKHDVFVQPIAGNLQLEPEQRSSGASVLYEFEPFEKRRYGFSVLSESTKTTSKLRYAGIGKFGVGDGNAVLLEAGFKEDKPKGSAATKGFYAFNLNSIKVKRGVNFQSILEYNKPDTSTLGTEVLRWGLGVLYFPFQRVEMRFQALQGRTMSPTAVSEDAWVAQAQLHLSL